MKKWLLVVLAVFCFQAAAEEKIYRYDSHILVNPDGSMTVTETIAVKAEGNRIKRGIYREFPTDYKDRAGHRVRVRFDVISVKRDGGPVAWSVKREGNGWRVYMGSMSQTIPPGDYTYELTYQTDRQLGFFDNYDELYWNVTGDDWAFSIDKASATVVLPGRGTERYREQQAFTGAYGSTESHVDMSIDPLSGAQYATRRQLFSGEGFTIVLSFEKGLVTEPSREQRVQWLLQDNRNLLEGLIGFLVLLAYYLIAWAAVGRDPHRGPIVPLYEPPEGLSPAAVRFIMRMGFDRKAMTASILRLAVSGRLRIIEADKEFTLEKQQGTYTPLSEEEDTLFNKLLGSRTKLELVNTNATKIQAALKSFHTTLNRRFRKQHFNTNGWWLVPGVLISLATVILMIFHARELPVAGFMTLWLSIWSLGVFGLLAAVFSAWRQVFQGHVHKLGAAVFLSLFSLPFLVGEAFGIYVLTRSMSFSAIGVILLVMLTNVVFFQLMKAPTVFGRRIMDQIEGFKQYLTIAEKDELAWRYPVDKTPKTFERFLPYALALDVENQWAERFAGALEIDESGTVQGYNPAWYSGSSGWSSKGLGGFAGALGSSFSSAVSSSATPPGSSSGSSGGGGFSGGGGGGGGGGGF